MLRKNLRVVGLVAFDSLSFFPHYMCSIPCAVKGNFNLSWSVPSTHDRSFG